mgnify:CR=1 FL=1
MATVTTPTGKYSIGGSVFAKNHPRIVNIMGYKIDVFPEGVMLFIMNEDIPGVIGKVGTFLGNNNINIASYILSREIKNKSAYSIIKVDEKLDKVRKLRPCFVRPKNELKVKKMLLDVLKPLVSRILSYDQKMKGKRPIYWKIVFQYFVKKLSFLIGYQ